MTIHDAIASRHPRFIWDSFLRMPRSRSPPCELCEHMNNHYLVQSLESYIKFSFVPPRPQPIRSKDLALLLLMVIWVFFDMYLILHRSRITIRVQLQHTLHRGLSISWVKCHQPRPSFLRRALESIREKYYIYKSVALKSSIFRENRGVKAEVPNERWGHLMRDQQHSLAVPGSTTDGVENQV